MIVSLDQYVSVHEAPPLQRPKEDPRAGLVPPMSVPSNLASSLFVGAGYDGERRCVFIKLYDPQSQRIHFWYDNTGHLPYCASKSSMEELQRNRNLTSHRGFLRLEQTRRFDGLEGKEIPVTLIYARDPLSIGGQAGCIREIITAWEADIRYVENYIYDRKLEPGMAYAIKNNSLTAAESKVPLGLGESVLHESDETYQGLLERWLRMLEAPFPNYRRVAMDIEVHSPIETRVPDPTEAEYRVICASLCSSDDARRVLILRTGDSKAETGVGQEGFQVDFFDREE